MEFSFGRRSGKESGYLSSASGLTEYRDISCVTAKAADIGLDPIKGGDNIQQTGIAGICVFFAICRQVQKTQDIQPVVKGNDDHIPFIGQIVSVV